MISVSLTTVGPRSGPSIIYMKSMNVRSGRYIMSVGLDSQNWTVNLPTTVISPVVTNPEIAPELSPSGPSRRVEPPPFRMMTPPLRLPPDVRPPSPYRIIGTVGSHGRESNLDTIVSSIRIEIPDVRGYVTQLGERPGLWHLALGFAPSW